VVVAGRLMVSADAVFGFACPMAGTAAKSVALNARTGVSLIIVVSGEVFETGSL